MSVVVGHLAHMGERRDVYKMLVGRPERNRPHVRLRRRWEDNMRWIFKKLNGGMDWTDLAQDRDR